MILTPRQKALAAWLESALGFACAFADAPPSNSPTADAAKAVDADSHAALCPLAGDASFRRYYRLWRGRRRWVVMDAPPEKESVAQFVRAAKWFAAAGGRPPKIHAAEEAQGFALLEDFGDLSHFAASRDNPAAAERLLRAAMHSLIKMQAAPPPRGPDAPPPYDSQRLADEMRLFAVWHADRHLGRPMPPRTAQAFSRAAGVVLRETLRQKSALVHRDYHSRNLMKISSGGAPGLLDFQDAVIGPIFYDVVSLLRDAYADAPRDKTHARLYRYWREGRAAGLPLPPDFREARRQMNIVGAQRGLKVVGIFARLWRRDGKAAYLADAPRAFSHLITACEEEPELAALGEIVSKYPPPQCKG